MERTLHLRTQGGVARMSYPITLPEALHARLVNKPLRLELTYHLTLAERRARHLIEAAPRVRHLAEVGWCKTRILQRGSLSPTLDADLHCLNWSRPPACTVTRGAAAGARDERIRCEPHYAPLPLSAGMTVLREAFVFQTGALPFQAPPGTTLVLETYGASGHFMRELAVEVARVAPVSSVRTAAAGGFSHP